MGKLPWSLLCHLVYHLHPLPDQSSLPGVSYAFQTGQVTPLPWVERDGEGGL